MEILLLRDDILTTCFAHRNIDTGKLIPPMGHHLCTIKVLTPPGSTVCAVKDGDKRFTYTTYDNLEAVATNSIKFCTIKALKMTGWQHGDKFALKKEQKTNRNRHR